MVERVDAVVIGAGLDGSAAAKTLTFDLGRKSVVLERHFVPGGYASSFHRGPYRFDTALHELNALTNSVTIGIACPIDPLSTVSSGRPRNGATC